MDPKKKRFQEELKRIQQLNAINEVLKKGDVENAFLNNTDKETETSKDTAVERMLEDMQASKSEKRNLELLDSLVNEETKEVAKPKAQALKRRPAAKPKSSKKKR